MPFDAQTSLFADIGAPEYMAHLSSRDRETLMMARDILRRVVADRDVIGSWAALTDYLGAALAPLRVEAFRVLFLDRKNRLIRDEEIGRGSVDHVPVYPREVARRALELGASAVILAHNHPSGDPTPSQADIDMTQQVRAIMDALGITLHDSVICGGGDVLSMRAEGLL